MNFSVTRRAATEQDDAFLYELFKAVRLPEFAHVPMAPAQLEMLMRMQYNGQTLTYTSQYPGGHDIVLLDGNPVGRIWVYRGSEEHQLVDISLLPEYRNRSIGAGLVTEAIGAARQAGVPIRCSVAVTNPGSLRFHQRLGFRVVGQDEMYYELALEPPCPDLNHSS
jgi:ribosomal protein S18 acetylase RimI-like enzyme